MYQRVTRILQTFLLAAVALLAGCIEDATPDGERVPALVTLRASTPVPVTVTPSDSAPIATLTTLQPATLPAAGGIETAGLVWEQPSAPGAMALAQGSSRLALILADGRFAWVDADNGQLESAAYVWSGLLAGDTEGEVYTDGIVAVAAVRQMSVDQGTGLVSFRARLIVYDAQSSERWSLPALEGQRYYSAALAPGPGLVFAGTWPHNTSDGSLSAYEQFTGQQLWHIAGKDTGFQQLIHDGDRLYALQDDPAGGGVAAYDLRTGDLLWRWSDPTVAQPSRIAIGGGRVIVLTPDNILALDSFSGKVDWMATVKASGTAGIGAGSERVYFAPAPSQATGYRPGVAALSATTGELAWQSLGGLLADPLAVSDEGVWVIVKDFDEGKVYLSGLDPETGLEAVRIPVSADADAVYQLVVVDRRMYILGPTLMAFGY